jgi:hypothetical protein
VTFDTCEVIEERWANWSRQDPVVAIDTQADNFRRLKALYIDCSEEDQFKSALWCPQVRAAAKRARHIAHRYEEFPDNHSGVDYRMDESLLSRAGAVRLMCMVISRPPPCGRVQRSSGAIRPPTQLGFRARRGLEPNLAPNLPKIQLIASVETSNLLISLVGAAGLEPATR